MHHLHVSYNKNKTLGGVPTPLPTRKVLKVKSCCASSYEQTLYLLATLASFCVLYIYSKIYHDYMRAFQSALKFLDQFGLRLEKGAPVGRVSWHLKPLYVSLITLHHEVFLVIRTKILYNNNSRMVQNFLLCTVVWK